MATTTTQGQLSLRCKFIDVQAEVLADIVSVRCVSPSRCDAAQGMRDHGIRLAAARQGQQADVRIVQIACADAASVQRVRDEHVACGARAAGVALWCR